jgi:hypothetical protein
MENRHHVIILKAHEVINHNISENSRNLIIKVIEVKSLMEWGMKRLNDSFLLAEGANRINSEKNQ